ncbi:MAG: pyruvate formate lyase family protein [Kiritimatiellia bacterium]
MTNAYAYTRRGFLGLASGVVVCGAPGSLLARSFIDMTYWDPFVPHIADVDTYLRRKFRQDVTDRSTGLAVPALKAALKEIVAAGKAAAEPWRITKAKCFACLVTRQAIDVSAFDWFPAIAIWNRWDRPMNAIIGARAGEVNARRLPDWVRRAWREGNRDGDWHLWQDFDHSVPDWRAILALGYPGMQARLERYAKANGRDDPFYESLRIAMDAMLAGIDRFKRQAQRNLAKGDAAGRLAKEIACLERLQTGKPQTAYDMLMFVWLYFFYSEHMDAVQCRSLTELDVFLTPYYEADLAAGRTTEAEFREQLKHFFWQWGSIANYWNHPIGLGGTKADGTTEFNHVSRIILEVADACNLTSPKFLVKIAPNTPDWVMDKLVDMARRHRSLAFIGEEPAAKALKQWCHASDEDCRTMVLIGCYEFALRDSANTTIMGYLSYLKPVEKLLADAKAGTFAAATFPEFKAEYLRRLADVTVRCRDITFESEKVLAEVNPANCMTLATEFALRHRKDGFADGCPHGNHTEILGVGLGTAVDALLAVKEIVYERRELTLAGLGEAMAADWAGHESLRLRMLRSKRKWGNNDPEANALGRELILTFSGEINGKPNSRGGIFLAAGHCARQFIELGAKTGATPDGRRKGEEMSKNLSPTMGMDTEGVTALVQTLSSVSVEDLPGDVPLDVMMHPSACSGAKGREAMKTVVRVFHANGGSVVQFTVFSAEELKDAQRHPEKYEDLQVRVCGWNVRWNDLPKSEQDKYITRAEAIQW